MYGRGSHLNRCDFPVRLPSCLERRQHFTAPQVSAKHYLNGHPCITYKRSTCMLNVRNGGVFSPVYTTHLWLHIGIERIRVHNVRKSRTVQKYMYSKYTSVMRGEIR